MTEKEEKEREKMLSILRRVYDLVELSHLNDHKLNSCYCKEFRFPRSIGEDIFNYLQSKDQKFKDTVIKRQKNFRKKEKNKKRDNESI